MYGHDLGRHKHTRCVPGEYVCVLGSQVGGAAVACSGGPDLKLVRVHAKHSYRTPQRVSNYRLRYCSICDCIP